MQQQVTVSLVLFVCEKLFSFVTRVPKLMSISYTIDAISNKMVCTLACVTTDLKKIWQIGNIEKQKFKLLSRVHGICGWKGSCWIQCLDHEVHFAKSIHGNRLVDNMRTQVKCHCAESSKALLQLCSIRFWLKIIQILLFLAVKLILQILLSTVASMCFVCKLSRDLVELWVFARTHKTG